MYFYAMKGKSPISLIAKSLKRFFVSVVVSFVLFELLWTLVGINVPEWEYEDYELLYDLFFCIFFTAISFAIYWAVSKLCHRTYGGSICEASLLIIFNTALIVFIGNLMYAGGAKSPAGIMDAINIFIICIISSFLTIINIQHSYHKTFVEMKQAQDRAHLNLLQQQMSPHFIFNSLSTLKGLVKENREESLKYIGYLSDITRYVTGNIGKERVTLQEAANFVENYMKMLDCRFPGHFRFSMDAAIRSCEGCIIPVSLQIAIENAIKHNCHSVRNPLEIWILTGVDSITVRNRKKPIFSEGLGTGLENLNERYHILVGKTLTIAEDDEYFSVQIPIIK